MEKRVRTGCFTCRKRRVKCDQTRPTCNRCRTANFHCEGYPAPRQAPSSSPSSSQLEAQSQTYTQTSNTPRRRQALVSQSASSSAPPLAPELSPRHQDWKQEQLPLYHHFVTTTVYRLFRHDHVTFWRDQVAQMSYGIEMVHEALLAIGAMHRSSLLTCQRENAGESMRLRILGLRAYGNVVRLLPGWLTKEGIEDVYAVLVVLMLLAYFECFLENPKASFRHLWASIQLLRNIETRLSPTDMKNLTPIYDTMLRLDLLAQKIIPFARSSFVRCADMALLESPFWNRTALDFGTVTKADQIASERVRLIKIICAHNKLSRVMWGCWCPSNERPSREELVGYYDEMMLWKRSSPATFGQAVGLDDYAVRSGNMDDFRHLPIPPEPFYFEDSEAALSIAMFNGHLGCAVAMIISHDEYPDLMEIEAYNIVYENLRIAAGLVDKHNNWRGENKPYKPCDSISSGISLYLFHGVRRCFSLAWQKWSILALRSIGREGLTNGYTGARCLEIMCDLDSMRREVKGLDMDENAYLGTVRDRLVPLLMPRGGDEKVLSFYLRFGDGSAEDEGDQNVIRVVGRAMWDELFGGQAENMTLVVYDRQLGGSGDNSIRPQVSQLSFGWRQAVEGGWHGYLGGNVQDGFLQ